jgi:ferric-dicitrate binding protein FerR (iron transport regulator)
VCAPIHVSNDVGLSLVRLPDGSEFQLYGDTQIEISMAGCVPGQAENRVLLLRGEVAGRVGPAAGGSFALTAPGPYEGHAQGAAAARFSPESGFFALGCIAGSCALGPDAQRQTPLASGEGGELDPDGNVNAPTALDMAALYAHFGDWLGIPPPPTASPTPSATPDLAATATSGCATFAAEFPGTPCP